MQDTVSGASYTMLLDLARRSLQHSCIRQARDDHAFQTYLPAVRHCCAWSRRQGLPLMLTNPCLPEAEDKFLMDNMSMRASQLFILNIVSPK